MTTILSAVAIIALLWTTLSALPAGLEARMPLPYMIALTPLLCVPLMILAAVAAWQHEWTAMSLLIVVALIASSQRINYWGTSIDRPGNAKNPTVKQPVKQLRRRCQKAITAIHRVPQTLRRRGPKPSPMDTVKQRVKHSRPSSRL